MREFSTPLNIALPQTGSLADDLLRNATDSPDRAAFSRRTADGWRDVSAAEFLTQVQAVAKGLLASGVEHGDRVVLLSRTRFEWTLCDYAIWYVGAVTVPVYETSSADQVQWILEDSGARAAVVETPAHAERIESVAGADPALTQVWVIDGPDPAIDTLTRLGAEVTDAALETRRARVTMTDPATLVYTSGTTGRPKGCVLTHGNFTFELGVAVPELAELFEHEDSATLLFLPLAHVFARIIQVGAVKARVRLGHSPDITHLTADLASFRPTFLLAVPRVFEKVFNSASQQAAAAGRGRIFDRAAQTAIAYSQALERGRVGPLLRARHALFDRLVYHRIREALGGRCRHVISGGAPLGERLAHFYRGAGMEILEGYGLTETTAAVTANLPGATRIGTVGRPLPGTTVRISDEGELLIRGGQVLQGYWKDPTATAEILDEEGWLHTGDLGDIDGEGYVRITGRKKEILVTAGGKNVAPNQLEDRLRAHPLISQAMVVGDGRPYIAALVTLDTDAFALWAEEHDKKGTLASLTKDSDLLESIQTAVDDANAAVSRAEAIRRFEILPTEWTEEGGHLTPSLKLKRNVVLRECRYDIERLYD